MFIQTIKIAANDIGAINRAAAIYTTQIASQEREGKHKTIIMPVMYSREKILLT